MEKMEKIHLQEIIEENGGDYKKEFDDMKEKERRHELVGLTEWREKKDYYKRLLVKMSIKEEREIKEMPEDMKAKMDNEYATLAEKYTINGMNFLKCQLSEVIKSLESGRRVEYEAFGPYLRDLQDYLFTEPDKIKDIIQNEKENTETGTDKTKSMLSEQNKKELALLKALKNELMPEGHAVSLSDEYNGGIAAALPDGRPFNRDDNPKGHEIHYVHDSNINDPGYLNSGVCEESEKEKKEEKDKGKGKEKSKKAKNSKDQAVDLIYLDRGRLNIESKLVSKGFRDLVDNILRAYDIVKDGEEEGRNKDYTLLLESEKVEEAKKLVEVLDEKGLIEGDITSETGEIWFQNTIKNCDDPRYLRIKLRSEDGHWECAALDASGFLDKSNLENTHLLILPKERFEEQQDKVWEILKSINFQPEHYHNIFIDYENEKLTPELAVKTLASKISRKLIDKNRK
jgi:hypothetical protein